MVEIMRSSELVDRRTASHATTQTTSIHAYHYSDGVDSTD